MVQFGWATGTRLSPLMYLISKPITIPTIARKNINSISSLVYVNTKSHEIERAKPELEVERHFSELQVKVLNYGDIFVFFFSTVWQPTCIIIENKEDALLTEDKEGSPESGKSMAPSQCNGLMAILASMNKIGWPPWVNRFSARHHLFRENARPQNGRTGQTKPRKYAFRSWKNWWETVVIKKQKLDESDPLLDEKQS